MRCGSKVFAEKARYYHSSSGDLAGKAGHASADAPYCRIPKPFIVKREGDKAYEELLTESSDTLNILPDKCGPSAESAADVKMEDEDANVEDGNVEWYQGIIYTSGANF